MVRVEMVAVGRELLIGRTLNTNSYWAGARLASLGSALSEVATIDDDLGEISRTLREALTRKPEFIVFVGGLGPTPDDMTLRGISAGLGVGLEVDDEALRMIIAHYVKRGLPEIELTPARKKMATLPEGAAPVRNPVGTAPGARIEQGASVIFCLPGVPREMRRMFRESVEPEVRRAIGDLHRANASLKVEGVYESDMAPFIGSLLKGHPGSYVKSHPGGLKEGRSRIVVDIAKVGKDREAVAAEVRAIAEEMSAWARSRGATVKSRPGAPVKRGR